MKRNQLGRALVTAGFALLLGVTAADSAKQQDNCIENIMLGEAALGQSEQGEEPPDGGYIADEVEVPALSENTGGQTVFSLRGSAAGTTAAAVPVSYDARDDGYVTSVKNQQDNTCWAYSAISMAESDLISGGDAVSGNVLTKDTADFSEDHLVYAFYHGVTDTLGTAAADSTNPLGWYRSVGGNHIFTTFGLANWNGLAEETQTAGVDWDGEEVDLTKISQSVHMQNAYWINLKQNPNLVKRMILEHGSAAISMYYVSYYMNSSNAAYYNNVTTGVNHAVAIIGWDDNYPAENFKSNPGSNGAWLAKNSYGTGAAGAGYFWISYQDAALTSNTAKAFIFDFEPAGEYDYIYQHDGTAGAYMESGAGDTGYRVASGESVANVFAVPQNTETGYQTLKAVSMALFAVNADYSVQIYKNPSEADNPASGTPLLSVPVTGKTSYVGYYTIPLTEQPVLSAGDTFSVVITLSKSNNAAVSYFVDKTYTNGSWISFVNETAPGESFAQTDGVWRDLSESGATARIKAFTGDYLVPASTVRLNQSTLTLWNDQTAQLTAEISPADASYKTVEWSSSNPAVAVVDENGCVTAVSEGEAVITALAKDNSGLKAECAVTVRQQAEAVTFTEGASYNCNPGDTLRVQFAVVPANASPASIYFSSSDETVATVDEDGTVHGKKAGNVVITVYSAVTNQVLSTYNVKVEEKEEPTTEKPTTEKPEPGDKPEKNPTEGAGGMRGQNPESEGDIEEPVLTGQEQTVQTTKAVVKTDDNSGLFVWLGIAATALLAMGAFAATTRASSR